MTRKHSLFSCLALLLLGANASQAGLNAWTLTGPEGGPVSSVVIHPTDASIVLASAGNGMYRSVDGGISWTRSGPASDGADIIFDPANPNRVFVLARSIRLYRSDDAGQTFAATTGPANATPHLLGMSGNSTLYMVDRLGRVHRSTDLALTWTEVSHAWTLVDEGVTALAVDRANANVLYVAVKGAGTYKSVDGGASWGAPVANSPGTIATSHVFQLAIKPDDPNRILGGTNDGVYVSQDAGATWSRSFAGAIWQAFAFHPAPGNNNVVALSFDGQIVRSSDGGLTWPGPERGAYLQVMSSPRVAVGPGNKVIVATSDGPVVSIDGGTTFTRNVSGMHAESLRSFSSTDSGVTYASFLPGPFGIYRRAGAGWEPVDNDELRTRIGGYLAVTSVTVAPSNPNRLFALGTSDQLVSSFDGGQSWSAPHPQFTTGNPGLVRVVVDPTNQQIIYVLTQAAGLWRSENGGATYVQRSAGLPTGLSALAIDRTNTQVLYAAGNLAGANGVSKSLDGGITWLPTGALPEQAFGDIVIDRTDSNVVYALGLGAFKSINGGATWTQMRYNASSSLFGVRGLFIDPIVPTTMYVGGTPTGYGISRSIDAGATWQHIAWTGAVLPSLGVLDSLIPDGIFNGNFFAGGWGTGLYEYHIANDLRLNFNSPLSFALGATGTLQVPIQNVGPYHAASPELQFNIPSNIIVTVPAGCRYVSPSMVCTLPNISVGETYTFALPYSASATPANLAMGVYLFGREVELTPNDTQFGIAVNVLAMADLGVTTTGTASVQRDQPITYTATITNSGPNSSAVTTLDVQVPAGITIQTRTPTVGTCTAANITTTTCELGALASGASASVSFTGTALTVGAQAWSSTVTTGAQDSVATNNTASLTTTVTAPPPPPSSGVSGGGGGGGGRFDWLAALLLGALALSRGLTRVSARR